jgi:hypothetical protein
VIGVARVKHVDADRDEIENHFRVARPEVESRFFGIENRKNVAENRTDLVRDVDLQSVVPAGVKSVDEVSVDLPSRNKNLGGSQIWQTAQSKI